MRQGRSRDAIQPSVSPHRQKTTVVTTNLAFNRWNEIIDDKVLVTAMVDRLTHKAILLNMTGKSFRMKETQEMMNQQI